MRVAGGGVAGGYIAAGSDPERQLLAADITQHQEQDLLRRSRVVEYRRAQFLIKGAPLPHSPPRRHPRHPRHS